MSINNFYERMLSKFPYILAIFVLRIVNWLVQGMLYAARAEQIAKISIDLILTSIFTIILANLVPLKVGIIIAFIIAHSFNWFFATNIWSTRIKKYSTMHSRIGDDSKYLAFLISVQKNIQKQNSIYGATIFGSVSTGKFHIGSDIDVKLFRKSGVMNLIKSYLFLFFMRTKANFRIFPLDIYVVDNINNYIPKKDEIPIILYDPDGILKKSYDRVSYLCDED